MAGSRCRLHVLGSVAKVPGLAPRRTGNPVLISSLQPELARFQAGLVMHREAARNAFRLHRGPKTPSWTRRACACIDPCMPRRSADCLDCAAHSIPSHRAACMRHPRRAWLDRVLTGLNNAGCRMRNRFRFQVWYVFGESARGGRNTSKKPTNVKPWHLSQPLTSRFTC